MFCTKCGHKNDDAVRFCVKCGQPLVQSEPQQQAYAPPQQQAYAPPQQQAYAPPQQAYAPMPVSPNRKRNIIIGVSAAMIVLVAALLLIFLLPGGGVNGTWYGSYGVKINFGGGGRGSVSIDANGVKESIDFTYEITDQEDGYIEGDFHIEDNPLSGGDYSSDFWYEKDDGEEVLSFDGEYFYRNKQDDWD